TSSSAARLSLHDALPISNAEAALAIVAAGWVADTGELNLPAAGVELNERKFVKVDEYMRTSAPHIFAAGDITGRMMLVPQALQRSEEHTSELQSLTNLVC